LKENVTIKRKKKVKKGKILAVEVTKILFVGQQKNEQLHFTRSHLYEKMSKMVVLLWIHSSRQVGYILEKS